MARFSVPKPNIIVDNEWGGKRIRLDGEAFAQLKQAMGNDPEFLAAVDEATNFQAAPKAKERAQQHMKQTSSVINDFIEEPRKRVIVQPARPRKVVRGHAQDLVGDRSYGENEELEFIKLLEGAGLPGRKANEGVVVNVGGSRYILPDTRTDNAYFENKIKYPTRGGYIGLEQYRYDSLRNLMGNEGFEDIFYVINPNVRPGAPREQEALATMRRFGLTPNQRIIAHMRDLTPHHTSDGTTYRNSRAVSGEPLHYFHVNDFDVLDLSKLRK